jgi:hypothetical protein
MSFGRESSEPVTLPFPSLLLAAAAGAASCPDSAQLLSIDSTVSPIAEMHMMIQAWVLLGNHQR